MRPLIYADNAATTRPSPSVVQAMVSCLSEKWGNPSSVHAAGREARKAMELSRAKVAAALDAAPAEIYFTSGGTESDNWAIKGAVEAALSQGRDHIVTTSIEHHAVLQTCKRLEKQGIRVTYLPADGEGRVTASQVRDSLTDRTGLVSVMYANNEIGTVEPIEEIGRVCREAGVLFHTDAVQAVGSLPIRLGESCIDLLSLSGHKLHGPKGVGALYVRQGVRLPCLLDGGGQERGLRSGTENLPAIVGLGAAMEEALTGVAQVRALRDRLIEGILERVPGARLNGSRVDRLPGNASFSFPGVEGEALLLRLDMEGICASSGSACTSHSANASHVLTAIGLSPELAGGSLRLSLDRYNTEEDIDAILETLPRVVERLREMRP